MCHRRGGHHGAVVVPQSSDGRKQRGGRVLEAERQSARCSAAAAGSTDQRHRIRAAERPRHERQRGSREWLPAGRVYASRSRQRERQRLDAGRRREALLMVVVVRQHVRQAGVRRRHRREVGGADRQRRHVDGRSQLVELEQLFDALDDVAGAAEQHAVERHRRHVRKQPIQQLHVAVPRFSDLLRRRRRR